MKQRLRKLTATNTRDPNEIGSAQFDPTSGGKRVLEVGKTLSILGTLDTAKFAVAGATVWCFNTDTAAHYVKTGGSSVAAPTGLADGIAIPAGDYFAVCMGLDTYIRSDSNKVGGYVQYDETTLAVEGTE